MLHMTPLGWLGSKTSTQTNNEVLTVPDRTHVKQENINKSIVGSSHKATQRTNKRNTTTLKWSAVKHQGDKGRGLNEVYWGQIQTAKVKDQLTSILSLLPDS